MLPPTILNEKRGLQMKITAKIKNIKYRVYCNSKLLKMNYCDFDINEAPPSFLLNVDDYIYGISKWVSPKRTRSYPYERVYNTLASPHKITIIPIIKDEGAGGDRDFIQWDTISLMSLLNVYVILAYYNKAQIHSTRKNKITNQKFDNDYIKKKINEIRSYHSSALHWNMKEVEETLPILIDKVEKEYEDLSRKLNVKFHNVGGIHKFKKQFNQGIDNFMRFSRNKAKEAQYREQQTIQPKEYLTTDTKATLTIENYLGGLYYFTTDEIKIVGDILYLIENKHSVNSKLPSIGDIKDGLLKMALYCNLSDVKIGGKEFKVRPVLKLTSAQISGNINTNASERIFNEFIVVNNIKKRYINIMRKIFEEASENNFDVIITGVNK